MDKHRLEGKTAIVTGANSGMGMATVAALSDEGCFFLILYFILYGLWKIKLI